MSNHQPIKLFISYSHQDEDLLKKLESHLALLKSQKIIDTWHDRKIGAGFEWQSAIDTHLEDADIILLLISADFLASAYCFGFEMQRAMERYRQQSAQVIPVALRPCDSNDADFMKLKGLPTDFKAVTLWSNQDEAFTNIAKGIRKEAERRHLVKPPVADLFGHF